MVNSVAQKQIDWIKSKCERIKPLVAIDCITYNHGPYIREALEGFVSQKTDFPYVAIIHDDASTDDTASVIREYAEKYPNIILPIYEEENQYSKGNGTFKEVSEIMRSAMDASGAKYIAYCEGDDYWIDPLKLQKQTDILDVDKKVSLVHSNFVMVDENNRIKESEIYDFFRKKSQDGYFLWKLFNGNYILTCTVMIRKDVYFTDFYQNVPNTQDYALFLSASLLGKAKYIDTVTAHYRQLPTGMMLGHPEFVDKRKQQIKKYLKDYLLNPQTKYIDKAAKNKIFFYYIKDIILEAKHNNEFLLNKPIIKGNPSLIFYILPGFISLTYRKFKNILKL